MEQLAGDVSCAVRFVGFQENVPDWLCAADAAAVPCARRTAGQRDA